MKDIIFMVGLSLLALLGIILIVDILLKNSKKRVPGRKKHRQKNEKTAPFHKGTVLMNEADSPSKSANIYPPPYAGDVRQGTLQYYGAGDWPREIPIALPLGGAFTIGRFDIARGQKVSDFEFAAESKAVSRSHAVISRDAEGFMIQDLGSKAGTIVNGVRLEPHVYYRLVNGFTVSFGIAGADYYWQDTSAPVFN